MAAGPGDFGERMPDGGDPTGEGEGRPGFFGSSGWRPTAAGRGRGLSTGRLLWAAAQLMLSCANPISLPSSGISEPSTPDASLKVTERFD